MQIEKITLQIGLLQPLHIAHMTDVHLSLADERDPHLIKHAAQRASVFNDEAGGPPDPPAEYLKKALAYAGKHCALSVITGDMIDFMSEATLETARDLLEGHDYMFTAGNHEFCPKVGIPDSQARKHDVFLNVQKFFRGNMYFESRIVGGVNLITVDNGYYNYSAPQIDALKREIKRGLPILLFSHVPLSDRMIRLEAQHKDLVPDEYMKEQNRRFLALVESTDLIKAEFAGHWHTSHKNTLPSGIPEFVTPGLFKGAFTHIEIL